MNTDETAEACATAIASHVSTVMTSVGWMLDHEPHRIHPEGLEALRLALEGKCELGVRVLMHAGTVETLVEDHANGRYAIIHTSRVAPLRPTTGFGDPDKHTVN
jgi:hypothetical protein